MNIRHGERNKVEEDGAMYCEQCDFSGKSEPQMQKHFLVRHAGKTSFAHTKRSPACRKREFCLHWPWCKFSHPEICRYQSECSDYNCNFVHLSPETLAFLGDGRMKANLPQNQQPPIWRPWG